MIAKVLVLAACCLAVSAQQVQRRYPQILRYSNDAGADGQFQYAYQTEDGISSEARGALVGPAFSRSQDGDATGPATAITGQYSYTGPDNQVYTVQYVADENGYRASGAHLPQPPPIPEAIQKSLELIRSSPQQPDSFQPAPLAQPGTPAFFQRSFSSFPQQQQAFRRF